MARRSDNDDKKMLRRPEHGKGTDQEHNKDEEANQQQEVEPEHARMQNQLGNQGVASLIAGQTGAGKGGAGVEVQAAKRPAGQEKDGQDYGGDDEPADPNAPAEIDLFEGWNPVTGHPSERAEFLEPMPDDELPPEDEDLLRELEEAEPEAKGVTADRPDPHLQPSPEILARSFRGWARGVARFAGSPLHRTWARLATDPPPVLQDTHGRVLLLRARTAALASACLIDLPNLTLHADTRPTLAFVLELEARHWRVRSARLAITDPKARPTAVELFLELIGEPHGQTSPGQPTEATRTAFDATLRAISGLADPRTLVPHLPDPQPVEADPDDPLGIDAVLATATGGARDPLEAIYRSALQGAERIAAALQSSRIRMAGVAAAVVDVCTLRELHVPGESLAGILSSFDAVTSDVMQLLREIARATQRRNVPIPAVRAALVRAATELARAQAGARGAFTAALTGVVPGRPTLPEPPAHGPDPLSEAWADSTPEAALHWLYSHPASLDRDVAVAFCRLTGNTGPERIADELLQLRHRALLDGRELLAASLGTCAGACLLVTDRAADAAELAAHQLSLARARGNGVLLADAALLGLEAAFTEGAEARVSELRRTSASMLRAIGAAGGLSLVLRWRPPSSEPTEEAPVPSSWYPAEDPDPPIDGD